MVAEALWGEGKRGIEGGRGSVQGQGETVVDMGGQMGVAGK